MWHCKCSTQFQQQSRFKLDPQRFLNWDLESFTTFQDAFDPFFRQLGHVLSLWLHRPARYVFSAALRALCSLSVNRQNNGVKGKKKTPCLSLIKGGRTFFFPPPLLLLRLPSNTPGLICGTRLERWSNGTCAPKNTSDPLSHAGCLSVKEMYSARLGRLRESLALFIKHQGCCLSRWLFGDDRWARMIGPVIETTGTFGGTVKGWMARNVWSQNHCFGNEAKSPQGSTKELNDTVEMSFSDSKAVPRRLWGILS